MITFPEISLDWFWHFYSDLFSTTSRKLKLFQKSIWSFCLLIKVDKLISMIQTWWGSRSSQQPRPPTLRTSHSQTSSLLTDQLIVKVIVANHRRLSLWSDALLLTTADHNLITSSHFWWITNCHFWICSPNVFIYLLVESYCIRSRTPHNWDTCSSLLLHSW